MQVYEELLRVLVAILRMDQVQGMELICRAYSDALLTGTKWYVRVCMQHMSVMICTFVQRRETAMP
jgi:hypothetical protein